MRSSQVTAILRTIIIISRHMPEMTETYLTKPDVILQIVRKLTLGHRRCICLQSVRPAAHSARYRRRQLQRLSNVTSATLATI